MTLVQPRPILAVGHSTHPLERFVELLSAHAVTAIADVRSAPFSRLHPQFNRDPLREALKAQGVSYVFLGRELGARSSDASCYVDGKVRYRKLAQTELFRTGLARVLTGAQSQQIALMCAEAEPLSCHRAILVARELEALGATVAHIRADGTLETHADALRRLLGAPQPDLFRSMTELIEDAYARQEERIAYVDEALRTAGPRVA